MKLQWITTPNQDEVTVDNYHIGGYFNYFSTLNNTAHYQLLNPKI